ncbi:MAG TPA: phenylacetate--CoA ligase family protein [Armatimonadota bacterium]|nr:phenylacetate--CoA ligase family protein [Armatimonadota bacterium]
MSRFWDDIYERAVGRGLLPCYETRLRGRNTFRYRDEFERNQWRSPEEIAALQWERLQALLEHAYGTVDYYRALFDQAGIRPRDIATPADFARLPILDKSTVREHRDRLVSSAFKRSELVRSATGGSTGEPMQFYLNRESYERRTAAAMRGDGWAGWRLCGPEFYIWGAQLLPQTRLKQLKVRLHFAGLRRTVVNSFELSPERVAAAVERYNRSQPRVVIGYANAVYEFARYVQQAGLRLHAPEGVIASAEQLYPYQRELIEEVFGARVFERYGCREVMMIGAECDRHEGLHVTADNLFVEVVRNGQLCEPGETGEILLTDLHNYGMPLIRYRVGDLGAWKGQDCSCGRGLPLLKGIEGRTLDAIATPSGRLISGVFFPHLFKDFPSIRTYQVIQEQRDQLNIRIALAAPFPPSERRTLEDAVARAVGAEMRVSWEMGEDVIIEKRSKFRPVVSRVPVDFGARPAE